MSVCMYVVCIQRRANQGTVDGIRKERKKEFCSKDQFVFVCLLLWKKPKKCLFEYGIDLDGNVLLP